MRADLAVRDIKGLVNDLAGRSAEARVAQAYLSRGYSLRHRRWRGVAGEIDLVFGTGDGVVFVEVKKSRSFDRALESLRPDQQWRLLLAAEEYLGTLPLGALTETRFDVALLNARGEIRVLENALSY